MKIDDGYNSMMAMPHENMGLWMALAIVVLLLIGFGVGYLVGRAR